MKRMICGIMRDLEAEAKAYNCQREAIRRVCEAGHLQEIARICARFELESDEFLTREQKAEAILAGGHNA